MRKEQEELTKVCCLGDTEPWLLLLFILFSFKEGDNARLSLRMEIGLSSLNNRGRVSDKGSWELVITSTGST